MLLFATGCEKRGVNPSSPPEIPKSFSADAEITFRELYMTAEVSLTVDNELKIRILTPEVLSPLEIICKDGICSAAYDGISFSVDTNRFPQADFASIAAQAFAYTNANVELKKSVSDGVISYQGSTDNGVFILTQDAESGAWLDLSVEGAQLHIVFSNFKLK